MKNRKFSKTGVVLVGCMVVCVLLFLAVGMPSGFLSDGGKGGDLDDKDTPGIKDVVEGGSPLLVFDTSSKAKELMTAFDEGRIESMMVLYDEMGSNEPYETTDQAEIKTVYKGLKNIVVYEESSKSVTDSSHFVTFVFDDGGEYGYSFEGTELLCYDGRNYSISGGEGFWEFLIDKCRSN